MKDEAVREHTSDELASQPTAGRAQCSVGSIDEDGIRYGLTTYAFTTSTTTTAPRIVATQSTVRQRGGRRSSTGAITGA